MRRVMHILRQEHREMLRLLDALGNQTALLANGCEPDHDLMLQIVDYFRSVPDLYHHPKEEMIAGLLERRVAACAVEKSELVEDHEEGTRLLQGLCRALVDYCMEPERRRRHLLQATRDFVDHQRNHIAWEEESYFSLAEQSLTDEDWVEIEGKLARLMIPEARSDERFRVGGVGRELERWRGAVA